MEISFGILGIIGGIMCAAGDVFLDYKGKDNRKLGKHKFIESNWKNMAVWRFKLSIFLAAAGVPLYFLGFTSLAMQMKNETFALLFWVICLIGTTGGFFIHAMICIFPILYKKMKPKMTFNEVEEILNTGYDAAKIPLAVQFLFLVVISSLLIIAAIILEYLSLPVWMAVITPLGLMVIGVLCRVIKRDWFFDLPGIIMPSIGISMIGLMAVLN